MRTNWTSDLIKTELLAAANELGHMPSNGDLTASGRGALATAIQRTGGYEFWRDVIGLEKKVRRTTWTDEIVESELRKIVSDSKHMPSNSELESMGRADLSAQVQRRGGFIEWANRIGAVRAHSDSDTGWDGEKALAEILIFKGFSVERSSAVKAPYDLRVDGIVRLDVKSANYAEYGVCKGWFYRIGKAAQADILALYQLDTKDVYFIPWNLCPTTNITISRTGGKYAEFKNRFDLLKQLSDTRASEDCIWHGCATD